jgi:hypothetical protein
VAAMSADFAKNKLKYKHVAVPRVFAFVVIFFQQFLVLASLVSLLAVPMPTEVEHRLTIH